LLKHQEMGHSPAL